MRNCFDSFGIPTFVYDYGVVVLACRFEQSFDLLVFNGFACFDFLFFTFAKINYITIWGNGVSFICSKLVYRERKLSYFFDSSRK